LKNTFKEISMQEREKKLSFAEVYDELIQMSQNIGKKLDISTEWIFMYFLAQNCSIKDFG